MSAINSKLETRNSKLFSLGFSPCPNDTFIFDALVNGKIDTGEFKFEVIMEDVEALNQRAMRGELDISKVSFATFANITDQYQLLNSGSALGRGVGPLVISDFDFQISDLEKGNLKIAIPGKNTTANFLFSLFLPESVNKKEMIFSDIESAALSHEVDAGVIIHENRFTYAAKGLKKICDLGELWEKETGFPIPLGGIAIRESFPEGIKKEIDQLIRKSIEYAFENPESGGKYVKAHSQEMEDDVIQKHIETYVNNYSIDLGEEGREAIKVLFKMAGKSETKDIFVPQSRIINHKSQIIS